MDETDIPPPSPAPQGTNAKPAPPAKPGVAPVSAPPAALVAAPSKAPPAQHAHAQSHGSADAAAHAAPTFSRWRVARAAGAGAASGLVLATGLSSPGSLFHEGPQKLIQFVLAGVILVVVGISIVEPFLSWLHHGDHHGDPHAGRPWRRTIATLIIILLTFLFVAVDGLLHETLAKVNSQFIGNWLGSFVSAAVVTYAWTRGVHRGPPFATIYGTLTAVGAMMLMWLFILGMFLLGSLAESERITVSMLVDAVVGFSLVWVMAVAVWFLCGLLGGLALDFGWGLPATLRVAIVVFFSWAVYTVCVIAITDEPRTWVADLARGLGWGLGLVLYRPSERALSTRRTPYTPSWLVSFVAFFVGGAATLAVGLLLFMGGVMLQHAMFVRQTAYMGSHKASVAGLEGYEHERYLITFAHNRGGQTLDSDDFAIRLWDHRADESYRSLLGHQGEVLDVREIESEHPPGLLSIGIDNTLRRWNVDRGMEDEVGRIELKPPPGFLASMARIHPEKDLVAIVGTDNLLLVFDASTRSFPFKFLCSGKVIGLEWVGEEHLIVATEKGEVWLVPIDEHGKAEVIGRHDAKLKSFSASPRHHYAATGDDNGVVKLWDLKDHTLKRTLKSRETPINSVAVNDDASRVIYGSKDDVIVLLSTADEVELAKFSHPGVPTALRFLRYWHIASAGGDGAVRVFRVPR